MNHLRSHSGEKFTKTGVAARFGVSTEVARAALESLADQDKLDTARSGDRINYIYNI